MYYRYLVPGTYFRVNGVESMQRHLSHCTTWYRYLVPGTRYQIPKIIRKYGTGTVHCMHGCASPSLCVVAVCAAFCQRPRRPEQRICWLRLSFAYDICSTVPGITCISLVVTCILLRARFSSFLLLCAYYILYT